MERGANHLLDGVGKVDVASAAHQLGEFLARFRLHVLRVSQEKMTERLSVRLEAAGRAGGVSESTYRKMEAGDPRVNFTFWLAALQELGTLEEVLKAAEPGTDGFHAMLSTVPGYEDTRS